MLFMLYISPTQNIVSSCLGTEGQCEAVYIYRQVKDVKGFELQQQTIGLEPLRQIMVD